MDVCPTEVRNCIARAIPRGKTILRDGWPCLVGCVASDCGNLQLRDWERQTSI